MPSPQRGGAGGGGGWLTTMWRVLLPNMRVAILSATVLTVACVLGELRDGVGGQLQILVKVHESSHVSSC